MELTRVRLKDLRELSEKHPGLLDSFLQAGQIQGDAVAVSREVFEELNGRFFDGALVGSKVHAILAPVVRVVDRVMGTSLESCGGCAERELRLNAASAKGAGDGV